MHDHSTLRGHLRIDKYRRLDPLDPLDPSSLLVLDDVVEVENLFLTAGINRIFDLMTGASTATYTNTTATIGVGDSSTAAAASQTDLQAATNKLYKAMDATYPMAAAGAAQVFRSTFGTADANFTWNEFVLKHSTSGVCIDRGVAAMGTKTSAATWIATLTLSMA